MREFTWNVHRPEDLNITKSRIISVDFAAGLDRVADISSASLKLNLQYIKNDIVSYLVKGPTDQAGFDYTSGLSSGLGIRCILAWSPDRTQIVYENIDWTSRPMKKTLQLRL